MLAVISPSKTQDFSSSNVDVFTKTRQIEQSQILIDLLKTKTQGEIASLMSISDKLSKLNLTDFKHFQRHSHSLMQNKLCWHLKAMFITVLMHRTYQAKT